MTVTSRVLSPLAMANWDSSAAKYYLFEKKWHYYARVAEGLIRPLRIRRTSRILELAGGTGACTAVLAKKCREGEVVSVERSERMAKLARANLRLAGLANVSFLQGDVTELSNLVRGMGWFHFVVCNSAFWQFPEPEKVLKAVRDSLHSGGTFAFNIPFWYRSEKEREAYRKKIDEILAKHSLEPSKFWKNRKPVDYRALLERSGLRLIKETTYAVKMASKEREEWRQIPVFTRRWGSFGGLPPGVASEIRREVRKANLMPWPEKRPSRHKWRLIVAQAVHAPGPRRAGGHKPD